MACFNLTSTAVLGMNVCSHHGARPTAHLTNTRLNLPPGSLSHALHMYTRISTRRDFPHLSQRLSFLPPQIPITVPVYSQRDNTAIYRCRKSKATGGGSVCRYSSSRKTYTFSRAWAAQLLYETGCCRYGPPLFYTQLRRPLHLNYNCTTYHTSLTLYEV